MPCRLQRSAQHILTSLGQNNVSHPCTSPTARDRQEDFRQVLHKLLLLLEGELDVAVALLRGCQGGKNVSAHAKISRTHVRRLLRPWKAQRNPPKVLNVHRAFLVAGTNIKTETVATP